MNPPAQPSSFRIARLLRFLAWTGVTAYFAFVAIVLVLRYSVLPGVASHQAEVERAASAAIGLPIRIGGIEASWDGLNPHLTLTEVAIADRQGRQAFRLNRVDAVLSWRTLLRFEPTLALLAVEGPVLHVRRDAAGRITVAGIDAEGETDPRLAEWVLAQSRIRIRDAMVVWEDALRGAPPLVLEDLQFGLDNRGSLHRFGLTAAPPPHLAARLDLRGEMRGDIGEALERLSGRLFVELDYADLSGWRTWVDYPVPLPQGRGALRLWADLDEGRAKATADLALEDVRIRLAGHLPELRLASMRGRLTGAYSERGWSLGGHRVELQSMDGIRIAPADFQVALQEDTGGRWRGSASASLVDVSAFSKLADGLPLDARSRELLTAHAPNGRIEELRASWEGDAEALRRYSLKARFTGLGLRAAGKVPGAAGLSGEVDLNEHGGALTLDSRDLTLDLPLVFADGELALGSVRGRASWKIDGRRVETRIERLEFSGEDAAGTARGTYRYTGEGPGEIDLTAALTRADGRAVWRYMPRVVNARAREWLRHGIVEGSASDARLVLKGDLRDFPFRTPGSGQFLVTAKAHGVKIDYAPGWPAIEDIDADMSFGVGMRVSASRGAILGTRLGPVVAEIPDFEAPEEMLLVRGQVAGPTSEFLSFIERSPVANKIDRFTEEMRAVGNGHLDLQLDMPLHRIMETRVRGEYQFQNNQVTVMPGLPPLSQVNGRLHFTEGSLSAQEINAQVFGGPMRLAVRNEADRVSVQIGGTAQMREVRKHFDWPLLGYVSGSAAWKGEVRVRKRAAEFTIDSNLAGVSSSLPDPLNKTAASSLPLRIEKKGAGEGHDQIRVTLGKIGEALLLRRQIGDQQVIERGALAIGESLPSMPAGGFAAAVSVPRLDADAWRRLLPAGGEGGSTLRPDSLRLLSIRTASMRLFNRDYAQVDFNIRPRGNGWQVGLSTREAVGDIHWRAAGEKGSEKGTDKGGWLQADFRRLAIPAEAREVAPEAREALDSLPGMDIKVADLIIGEKRLGRLELKAHNAAPGTWQLDSVVLANADATLKGQGQWQSQGKHQRTRLDFELASGDAGKLLDRLGYPGTLRRGSVTLKGDLAWDGGLTAIDYPSLSGRMALHAEKGQFAKIDPGLGKLLGLLSLQSLPRRLTLDFRDIFSEGFAFDSIDSRLDIAKGVMRTADDLRIDGPAARILMRGQADLGQETQDVLVTVQPEIGSVLSVGAIILAHPVVGAATAVVNKLLQNPIDKIFSFRYRVQGDWDDPKIEKVEVRQESKPAEEKP